MRLFFEQPKLIDCFISESKHSFASVATCHLYELLCFFVFAYFIFLCLVGQLTSPSKGFEDVIRNHFRLKKTIVEEQCQRWLDLAQRQ